MRKTAGCIECTEGTSRPREAEERGLGCSATDAGQVLALPCLGETERSQLR